MTTAAPTKIPYAYLPLEYSYWKDRIQSEVLGRIEREARLGQFTIGPAVQEFEEAFAAANGFRYAVGVNSGTDALELTLRALDAEAIVTAPNTFMATAGAALAAGCIVYFQDVMDNYLMDPSVDGWERVVMMPVELTGRPYAAMEYRFPIVVDSAQAVGALGGIGHGGGLVGSAKANCYSLHPLKNVHVWGDGGVICTQDQGLRDHVRLLRNHGAPDRDTVTMPGHNSRLDTIQAVVGLFSLSNLQWVTESRRTTARTYDVALKDVNGVVLPPRGPEPTGEVFHTYVIQVDHRDKLQQYLTDRGIETKVHYPVPLHLQPGFASLGYKKGDFPVAEAQADRILSLPIHEYLTDSQVQHVVESIQGFYWTKP
jgi:aminotransferase EvaB